MIVVVIVVDRDVVSGGCFDFDTASWDAAADVTVVSVVVVLGIVCVRVADVDVAAAAVVVVVAVCVAAVAVDVDIVVIRCGVVVAGCRVGVVSIR